MKKIIFVSLKVDYGGGNKVIYEISKKFNSEKIFLLKKNNIFQFIKSLIYLKQKKNYTVISSDPIACLFLSFCRIEFIRFVQAIDLILFKDRLPSFINSFYRYLYIKSLNQKIIFNSEFVKKELILIKSKLNFLGKITPGTNFKNSNIKKKFDLVFILRKAPWKNSAFSLKIISQFINTDIKIVIIDPDDFLNNKFKEMKNIIVYNYVDRKKLNILFQKSKFYFSSTQFEGFGMPCLESMRSGCIPIAPKGCGHDEFMIHKRNSILYDFNNIDIDNFFKNLFKMNNSELNNIKTNGISSSKLFSWKKTFNDFSEIMSVLKNDQN